MVVTKIDIVKAFAPASRCRRSVEPVGFGWLGFVRSVIVPVCVPLVITGKSLAPLMVMVTVWVFDVSALSHDTETV